VRGDHSYLDWSRRCVAKRAIMRRVFGVKKEKAPAPTVEEATQRVSSLAFGQLSLDSEF
jgi:hypothetical protein